MIPQAPKGTDDILPPASEGWRRLLRGFEDLAVRYGYGFTMTPLFEATELFSRGVGVETEVVEKQMYTFEDKGGRSITLRPEATASVVRAYLGSGTQGVFKGYYAGPMFRYEQPQSGRRRQFYQVGVEYLAEPSPDADVEVIEVGYRLLQQAGITEVTVRLNSIGDPADRAAYREALVAFLKDRADLLSDEARSRMSSNPLRVLDSKADASVVADAPAPLDAICEAAAAHFAGVVAGLQRRGIPYEISPRLVRGLDYYNRTVFEYVSAAYTAAQEALGGGGRYDPLAEMLGGPPVAAVGLAMGVDRIVLAMPKFPPGGPDVFVAVADPARREDAIGLVAALRDAGLWSEMDLGDRSLKAQFKVAGRRGSRLVAVVGDEWSEGLVTVRRMSDGEERPVAIEEVASWATNR
ncbi:MAG: histidine--tRNA ligase [Actinobacteria bacterium]|nr:histidine--tRNA ligase [Actinomycetota bacterium]MBU1493143.1 histidine--tRNA ligase [Actinomycetota bacterium]